MTSDSSGSPQPAAGRKGPLPDSWDVPQVFRDRLGDTAGRQRVMFAEGHLLLVLHEPPGAEDARRTGRFFWRSPDGPWRSNALGTGIQSLRKHLESYTDALDRLDREELEAGRADDYLRILRSIAPLVRATSNQHQVLQEARETAPEDHDLIVCRDLAGHLQRMAELLQSDTRYALDAAAARRSEEMAQRGLEMSRSAHRLNLLAAFFFPLATLTALFGMNLSHGLEGMAEPWMFWIVFGLSLACGLVLWSIVAARSEKKREEAKRRDPFS